MADFTRACLILRAAGEQHSANILDAVEASPELADLFDDQWWAPQLLEPDPNADLDLDAEAV